MNSLNLRCLNETAIEMLDCYATTLTSSTLWLLQDVWFSQFNWKYGPPAGQLASGWRLYIDDREGISRTYEITESQCVRVIYALTCNADLEIIRESLENFQAKE